MVKSMTGYGYAEYRGTTGLVSIEIKSVNHKYFDISSILPGVFSEYEDRIRDFVKKKVKRGKIYLSLKFESKSKNKTIVAIDKTVIRDYLAKINTLKKQFSIKGDVTVQDILQLPGVIKQKTQDENLSRKCWPDVKHALTKALEKFLKNREREGVFITRDIIARINDIQKTKTTLQSSARENIKAYKRKLRKNIKTLTGNQKNGIDSQKLASEVALFAKSCDITEEVVRLKSHLMNFKRVLQKEKQTGKKLDFIAQEMHREANTIGAKANNYKISQNVIHIKSQIEKVREQLKNIE